jgi:hypothetical protein
MPISPDLVPQIAAWMATKMKNVACTLCGTNSWDPSGFTNFPVTMTYVDSLYSTGIGLSAPRMLPSIALVCLNCGNTIFLNAKVAGLVKP